METELFEEPPPRTCRLAHAKRYQDCSFLVRMWRRRHYIPIPFQTLYSWLRYRDQEGFTLLGWWQLHIGLAQVKMLWIYDMNDWSAHEDSSLDDMLNLDEEVKE